MKNKNNFIERYRKDFDKAYNIPDMLEDIKKELTFTPHIIFSFGTNLRLAFELLFMTLTMIGVKMTYSNNIGFGMDESGQSNQFWILLGIASLLTLCFLIDFTHKLIKLYRLRIKKMAK